LPDSKKSQDFVLKSLGLQGFFDSEEVLEKSYTEKRKTRFHGLFKDIEIRRNNYILLGLCFLSIINIVTLSVVINISQFQSGFLSILASNDVGLFLGIGGGLIFSAIIIDVVKKRLVLVQLVLVINTVCLIIQVSLLDFRLNLLNAIFFFINGFTIVFLFLIFLTLFLEYTSLLERGRVLFFLLIETLVIGYILLILAAVIYLITPLLSCGVLLINAFTIYYLQKHKEYEKPPLQTKIVEEKHFNYILLKYLVFIFLFSFIIGSATPLDNLDHVLREVLVEEVPSNDVVILIGFVGLFAFITGIIVGQIFDFFGRLSVISTIMIIISIAIFLNIFETPIIYLTEIIIASIFLAAVSIVPLLIGDVTKRRNFGKILVIAIVIFGAGDIIGLAIKNNIQFWFSTPEYGNLVLLGIQYVASTLALIILVNSKETLPHKEKEWYESLIHFYVIHQSGMLLYEHEFLKVEEALESDLVSGGIIGLTTILKEIVKGKDILRTIDHGDKKLMFKYSPDEDVIFVLTIVEDLIVLRDKLDHFILDFMEEYGEKAKNLDGVIESDWEGVSTLIERYFTRKYFERFVKT